MAADKQKRRSRRGRRKFGNREPWRRYLWEGRSNSDAVPYAKEMYTREQMAMRLRRRIAADLGWAKLCRRRVCRRTGVCSGPECLVDLPPVEETPETQAALKAFHDGIRARVAELKAAED